MKKSLLRSMYSRVVVAVSVCSLLLCAKAPVEKHAKHFLALDTVIDVTVYSASARTDKDIDSLEALIRRIEAQLSINSKESEIYKINNRTDSVVTLSKTMQGIMSLCRSEYAKSNGLFDVTVEPLKFIYGLESHQSQNHVPSQSEIDSALALIGFGKIRFLSDSVIVLPQGVRVDFGGIAKGYVLIQAKQFLLSRGHKMFLVNLGGDLVAIGLKPDGAQWNIGIQHPRNSTVLISTMSVNDHCVFTSGDYERCFLVNGKRYHHLFNPKTGIPGSANMSATAVGDDPLSTDAAVKTAFLMPPIEALEYLSSRNMLGFLIDSTGTGWANEGLRSMLHPDSTLHVNYK